MRLSRAILIFSILIFLPILPIFADDDWIVAETDRQSYQTGDQLTLSGYILEKKMPVMAMSIYDPDGTILAANTVELEDDNSFTRTVSLDAPFYEKDGTYSIKLNYGKMAQKLSFEIESSNPEPVQPPSLELVPEVIIVNTDKKKYQNDDFISITGAVSSIGDLSWDL